MDILILNWKDIKNPSKGGAEVIAFEFAKRLAKDGHQVTFFSRGFRNSLREEIIENVRIVRRGNVLTVYLHAFLYYIMLTKKPDRVIDMVNTLCWQTPLYVSEEKRIMYVNQLAKEVLFYELPWPISLISYLLERFEYMPYQNTKVLCYSQGTKKDLISFGIPEKNITLFPMGLDHTRYIPTHRKASNPLFVFVARLVKMKRPELCIKAMVTLVKQVPSGKLMLIGNGPEEEKLKRLIKDLNLRKNVFLVTTNNFYLSKNNKDVKLSYMQKAWALILPSVKEGWGMVITEAAACATPAIVSNVTGLTDSVINGKTGIILSPNPTELQLAHAMKNFSSQAIVKKMGKNCVEWAKKFSWEKSYKVFKKEIFKKTI